MLGDLGIPLEGGDGRPTTGFAELPEDPQCEVRVTGRIDEGCPVPDEYLVLRR